MLIFRLIEKEGTIYRYLYARGNKEPDGMISIDSVSKEIKIIKCSITDEDDIVMDFFSGSATTAHALMKLNAEDNGKRSNDDRFGL